MSAQSRVCQLVSRCVQVPNAVPRYNVHVPDQGRSSDVLQAGRCPWSALPALSFFGVSWSLNLLPFPVALSLPVPLAPFSLFTLLHPTSASHLGLPRSFTRTAAPQEMRGLLKSRCIHVV
eukprot:6193843-Pleurochrysis_carterae.AAC.2